MSFSKTNNIIVANHRASLDPFVLVSSLRVRDFFRLAPFSFMTANKFMEPLWLRPFAWAAGCFPAHPGLGPHGIEKALTDIDSGYTLVMFPEGRRVRKRDDRPDAKPGIGIVLERSPKARLIMVHIEWQSRLTVEYVRLAYPQRKETPLAPNTIMDTVYLL